MKDNKGLSSMRSIKVLAATVVAVGIGYLAYSFMSQDQPVIQSAHEVYASADARCSIDQKIAGKIKSASSGEMKAFLPMDRSYSLASFRFNDEDGKPKTIADWKHSIVLVNLWATWCAPCRAEMPSLDALQRTLGSEKFEVVPISVDRSDPAKPKKFFEEISISAMRFFHDREAMTLNALKREGLALGLPATLLVDGNGCVIGRLNGPAEWASKDAQNLIKAALQ